MPFHNERGEYIDVTFSAGNKHDGFIDGKKQDRTVVFIQDTHVPISARQQGRFTAMLDELENWMRGNGYTKIRGIVTSHPNGPDDNTLIQIYEGLGFEVNGSRAIKMIE